MQPAHLSLSLFLSLSLSLSLSLLDRRRNFIQYIDTTDGSVCIPIRVTDKFPVFDGTTSGGSLKSDANIVKCSLLHTQQCALRDMKDLFSCFDTAHSYIINSGTNLDSMSNWTAVGPTLQSKLPSTATNLCTFTSFIASGATCGSSAGPSDVCWMLKVSTRSSLLTSCGSSLLRSRCAQSSISMSVYETLSNTKSISCALKPLRLGGRAPLPFGSWPAASLSTAFNASDPDLCGGDYLSSKTVLGSSCLAVDIQLCQGADGDSSFCIKASSSSFWSSLTGDINTFSIPGLWFGPTVLQDETNGAFRRDDRSKTCSPWPFPLPLDTNASGTGNLILPALVKRLFGFVNDYTLDGNTALRSYFVDSTIGLYYNTRSFETVLDVPAATRVVLGSSPFAIFWSTNLVYCCEFI